MRVRLTVVYRPQGCACNSVLEEAPLSAANRRSTPPHETFQVKCDAAVSVRYVYEMLGPSAEATLQEACSAKLLRPGNLTPSDSGCVLLQSTSLAYHL